MIPGITGGNGNIPPTDKAQEARVIKEALSTYGEQLSNANVTNPSSLKSLADATIYLTHPSKETKSISNSITEEVRLAVDSILGVRHFVPGLHEKISLKDASVSYIRSPKELEGVVKFFQQHSRSLHILLNELKLLADELNQVAR